SMTQPGNGNGGGSNGGDGGDGEQHVMVVGPDGRPLGMARVPQQSSDDEVKSAPLDDASRVRLRTILSSSVRELEEGLAPELRDELNRLSTPFADDVTPSDAELRIAQAQLVGWLEGLFQGIQTALFAQQMAARAQLEQMR